MANLEQETAMRMASRYQAQVNQILADLQGSLEAEEDAAVYDQLTKQHRTASQNRDYWQAVIGKLARVAAD